MIGLTSTRPGTPPKTNVIASIPSAGPDIEIIFVSAKSGEGVEDVVDWIEKNATEWNQ